MSGFRFEDLTIWQDAIALTDKLFDIADKASDMNYYRFGEQLRAAALSISNNISEGSGSFSNKDFANFLNFSRRSVFECANMLVVFQRRGIISQQEKEQFFEELRILSSKITNFRKAILKK